jgi:CRP-like cAMP-binding protein
MSESARFERLLYRYALALFDQAAQHAACNRLHALEERCARWLLMTHDRVDGDVLPLKQQFLAEMLGVHRPAVTLAAGALQKAGVIRYTRGKVTVLDREALENASCECYRIIARRDAQLLATDA